MITPRDINILATVASLCVATAAQVRRQCLPTDNDGRVTRRRLQSLIAAGLLQKTRMEVVDPLSSMNAPVYYSSRKGLEFLAIHLEDQKYLALSSQRPQWQHLQHWVAISDLHILIEQAAAQDSQLTVNNWTNEYDVVNKDAAAPEDKFRLYTMISKTPKVVCVPDYMFALKVAGHTKFFGELERGTTAPEKAAAEKSPGYAGMLKKKLHKRFCPEAVDSFAVLVTAPTPSWRDALVRAFKGKEEPSMYRFAALQDLKPESFFRGEVWHRCDGKVGALVKSAGEGVPVAIPVVVQGVSRDGHPEART